MVRRPYLRVHEHDLHGRNDRRRPAPVPPRRLRHARRPGLGRLAPLAGSSPDVGVVGYSLGGGISWLARRYGLSANSVHAIELVNADGEQIRASADENPDLFWALRGGGGSFGIVTAIEIALYP